MKYLPLADSQVDTVLVRRGILVLNLQVGEDCWYGGGCDLTPAYFFEEDTRAFHKHWHDVCESHEPGSYSKYKEWCDRYFYIPARKEHRGVGGIFFDDLSIQESKSAEQVCLDLPRHLSDEF